MDLFDGQKDLKEKIIRAVGNPEERFNEDALRIMRAVRFSAELDFDIEKKTEEAIEKEKGLLGNDFKRTNPRRTGKNADVGTSGQRI